VSQYEGKMVISVDEANKKITVTTLEAANAKGMTVYDTKQ
jgi:hypothetical protein